MRLGTANLIVLEDNDEDFEVLQMACERIQRPTNLQRYTRSDPLIAAIRAGSLREPTLLMLDLRMPGGGSQQVLESFKRSDKYCRVPVVVLSTSTNPIEIAACYASGASAFHSKVVETPEMIERLIIIMNYWLEQVILSEPVRTESDG